MKINENEKIFYLTLEEAKALESLCRNEAYDLYMQYQELTNLERKFDKQIAELQKQLKEIEEQTK